MPSVFVDRESAPVLAGALLILKSNGLARLAGLVDCLDDLLVEDRLLGRYGSGGLCGNGVAELGDLLGVHITEGNVQGGLAVVGAILLCIVAQGGIGQRDLNVTALYLTDGALGKNTAARAVDLKTATGRVVGNIEVYVNMS